jgi:hypothetical protein
MTMLKFFRLWHVFSKTHPSPLRIGGNQTWRKRYESSLVVSCNVQGIAANEDKITGKRQPLFDEAGEGSEIRPTRNVSKEPLRLNLHHPPLIVEDSLQFPLKYIGEQIQPRNDHLSRTCASQAPFCARRPGKNHVRWSDRTYLTSHDLQRL